MAAIDADGPPKGIRVRDLDPGDIDAGLALTEEVGWNQTIEDWAWMIGRGRGWACLDADGRVVATALTQPQSESFGWISMVLVTAAWRRRGVASFLMARSILTLGESGHVAGLDATPAGRAVYGALGFRDIYGLTRFRADRVGFGARSSGQTFRPLVFEDLSRLATLDRTAFGADRRDLLADLARRAPKLAWLAEAGDGFCLGRNGRGAYQLGPVVADDTETAMGLLAAAFQTLEGPVMIDVPDHHTELVAWLTDAGFRAERPYTRMLLDHDRPLDDPAKVFAIAGPELG